LLQKKVVCLEVVEVNPLLDTKGNKMAETAFEVLEKSSKQLIYGLDKIKCKIVVKPTLIIDFGVLY
jgi:hypothetical protein